MSTEAPSAAQILAAAQSVLASNNAVQLATTGAAYSPWVAGAYFAHDGADLILLLETSGKSLRNIQMNPSVAFSISQNDAMKDFVQGRGTAEILPDSDEPAVRAALVAKMPWYQTYTPVVPVRIRSSELHISSLTSGWFPAKVWRS